MKKDATPEHKWLKGKTYDEKKETSKCKGFKKWTSDEKEAISQTEK
jgi:hypothetical protein